MTNHLPSSESTSELLKQLVSDHKLRRIEEVLALRTRHLTLVLEDVHHTHNASACLRTCDCFGVQDVHAIEDRNEFEPSRDIVVGAGQWLNLVRYQEPDADNARACYESLKAGGYRIIAASPHADGISLDDYDVTEKTALVFGSEVAGLSQTTRDHADGYLTIPMSGFTESLNVSVAVALCLYELTTRLRGSDVEWRLSQDEMETLRTHWIRGIVNKRMQPEQAEQFWKTLAQRSAAATTDSRIS